MSLPEVRRIAMAQANSLLGGELGELQLPDLLAQGGGSKLAQLAGTAGVRGMLLLRHRALYRATRCTVLRGALHRTPHRTARRTAHRTAHCTAGSQGVLWLLGGLLQLLKLCSFSVSLGLSTLVSCATRTTPLTTSHHPYHLPPPLPPPTTLTTSYYPFTTSLPPLRSSTR